MRNRTFDLFKWVAALFVLLLHVPFPGDVGGTVRMFARWAVPFFFMVSGYFTCNTVRRGDTGRLVRRVRRLAGIYIPAACFYALWCCFLLSNIPFKISFLFCCSITPSPSPICGLFRH